MKRLIILFAFLPSIAFGLGYDGHRIVCQIAFDELTSVAKTEVNRLLALDPDFEIFAESCLFAEAPKRIRWLDHQINLPRSTRAITTADCPLADPEMSLMPLLPLRPARQPRWIDYRRG